MPAATNRCAHCGSTRGAWEFRDGVPYRVKLVTVTDRGHILTLCEACNRAWVVEKRDGEAVQMKLFD